jgi:histidinol phosphatase-like PHP family hydrolase
MRGGHPADASISRTRAQQFDIVLASRERARTAPDQLMKRYAGAMKHPLVALITHPTNRMVPHRKGYDLDYDRLFDLAVQTGTALKSTARQATGSRRRSPAVPLPPARRWSSTATATDPISSRARCSWDC